MKSKIEKTKLNLRLRLAFLMLTVLLGIGTAQADTDGDGVPDSRDNCPSTPNPEKTAFVSDRDGNSEIYVMDADGSNPTRLTNNAANDFEPSFSPDGSKIAFRSFRDGNFEIYVMNADGSNQTNLTNNAAGDLEPSFSPDGSKIAFRSLRDGGNAEIYVMNADGTNPIRLTNNPAGDFQPSFSPDGSKIAFVSTRDGNSEIYVINADGTNPIRLTNSPTFDVEPSFSPDGSKIAFRSFRDGNSEIYAMDADGSNPTNLTNNSAFEAQPSFNPEGSKIAFASTRDGNSEIYAMNADGTNQTRLTNNAAFDVEPSWGRQADSDGDGIGDACENTPPTITPMVVTLAKGSPVVNLQIAAVSDVEDDEDALTVTVNGSTGSTTNGVTVSNIAVDSSGSVTANVVAVCGASNAGFILRVTDSEGAFSEATLNVTVTPDNIAPVINLSSGVISLFPPNHKYKTVQVSQLVASVSDNCSTHAVSDVVIEKVTSDEVDDAPGGGDGNTVNDIVIGGDCKSAQLRAERDGNRNGRVYTITLRLRDAAGNTTTAIKKISVPHSQNGNPAIDDGAAYTVISSCP